MVWETLENAYSFLFGGMAHFQWLTVSFREFTVSVTVTLGAPSIHCIRCGGGSTGCTGSQSSLDSSKKLIACDFFPFFPLQFVPGFLPGRASLSFI